MQITIVLDGKEPPHILRGVLLALTGDSMSSVKLAEGAVSVQYNGPDFKAIQRAMKAESERNGTTTLGAKLTVRGGDETQVFTRDELIPPIPQAGPLDGFVPPPPGALVDDAALAGDPPLDTARVGFGAGAAPLPTVPPVPGATSIPANVGTVPALPPGVAAGAQAVNAAPSSPAPSGDVDKEGMPWDERIHAGSKEKNKDGTWRRRRNLQDSDYERVAAELRALSGKPPVTPTGNLPPLPDANASKPVVTDAAVTPFNQLLRDVTPHLHSIANPTGKLRPEHITQAAAALGLVDGAGIGQFMLLQGRTDLIPAFIAEINKHLV